MGQPGLQEMSKPPTHYLALIHAGQLNNIAHFVPFDVWREARHLIESHSAARFDCVLGWREIDGRFCYGITWLNPEMIAERGAEVLAWIATELDEAIDDAVADCAGCPNCAAVSDAR